MSTDKKKGIMENYNLASAFLKHYLLHTIQHLLIQVILHLDESLWKQMEPKKLPACLVKAGVLRHISPVLIRNVTKWWILRSCWNTATGNELWHKSYGPWGPNCILGNYGTEKRNDPCNPLNPKSRVKIIFNAQKEEIYVHSIQSSLSSSLKIQQPKWFRDVNEHNQRFVCSTTVTTTVIIRSEPGWHKDWHDVGNFGLPFLNAGEMKTKQQTGTREGTETEKEIRIIAHPCKGNIT